MISAKAKLRWPAKIGDGFGILLSIDILIPLSNLIDVTNL